MLVRVQFVGEDGCYLLGGVRVRCGRGNGEGSLGEERARGVRTPFAGDRGREMTLGCIGRDPELRRFVEGLPVARLEPADCG